MSLHSIPLSKWIETIHSIQNKFTQEHWRCETHLAAYVSRTTPLTTLPYRVFQSYRLKWTPLIMGFLDLKCSRNISAKSGDHMLPSCALLQQGGRRLFLSHCEVNKKNKPIWWLCVTEGSYLCWFPDRQGSQCVWSASGSLRSSQTQTSWGGGRAPGATLPESLSDWSRSTVG